MNIRDVIHGVRTMLLACLLAASLASPSRAGERPSFGARSGFELASSAALRWAADARLVYIENDEALSTEGDATRWGYLFRSASLDRSRAYSVRDGRILVAEDLEMRFEAPALQTQWLDSAEALAIAEREGGRNYRTKHQGSARTMLLMRGAFQDSDPDPATWTVVYTSPGAPALFVMVDAIDGKVRRTWRG